MFEQIGAQESLKKIKMKRRWMFHPQGLFKIIWDLILMVFVLWSCVYVPFSIAYGANDWDLQVSSTIYANCISQGFISILIIEYIIDIYFIIDIAVNFRTMMINSMTGEPIDSPKQIALSYIFKGRFVIDLLAWIPFELISFIFNENKTYVKPIKLLKLSRLLRIGRIITYMKTRKAVKSSLKVITMILFLMLWIHWTNWLWFATVDINQTWIAPKDQDSGVTILYTTDYFTKYIFIYWYAAQMVIGVDLFPTNHIEVLCWILISITGPILLGIIISIFSELLSDFTFKQRLK